jgi:outer membrane protein assembly factor BamB
MKFIRTRIAISLAASAVLLSGCEMMDSIGDIFNRTPAVSNLQGERIPVLPNEEAVSPDPALQNTPVVLPAPYRTTDWTQPGGFSTNALYHLEAPGPLRIVWEQATGKGSDSSSRLTAPPIVAGGKIYVLDAEARVLCYQETDGRPLWSVRLAPVGQSSFLYTWSLGLFGTNRAIDPSKGFGGGLAFDDGKLFVTTGFGDIFALNPQNGRQIWKVNVQTPIVNAPVANGGRVFVSSADNHFVALAESDGHQLWEHRGITETAGILVATSAAVSGENVIVPYSSGEIFAMRVQTGQQNWSDMLTSTGNKTAISELDDIAGRPVIDRDMVFAISHSGTMVGLKLSTGDRVWERGVGGTQTPWPAGDWVYVLTVDGQVLCLSRKDGHVRWMHQMEQFGDPEDKEDPITWSGPVLVSDRLVMVSSHGYAVSLSPYTGQLLGRMEIPDGAYIPPVVANGTLYIYTNDAELVALR